MEDNWGRRNEIVKLDEATLRQMLKPVTGEREIASFELLTTGKANTSYKVQLDGLAEPLLLRLHIRDQLSCQKEFNIFQALHTKVPMAEILYFEPSPTEFGFPYSINKWVEGQLLDHVFSSQDIAAVSQVAYKVGATLAAIGTYRFSQPGLLDHNLEISLPFSSTAESWASFIRRSLSDGHTGRHLWQGWSERLEQLITENNTYLNQLPDSSSLIHADFKGLNILVHRAKTDWRVAAVLDWEFAYAGSPLSDVGTIMRHQNRFNPAFKLPFINGFAGQGGQLPEDWEKAARLLDLLNLCDFLNQPEPDATLRLEVTRLIIETIKIYDN